MKTHTIKAKAGQSFDVDGCTFTVQSVTGGHTEGDRYCEGYASIEIKSKDAPTVVDNAGKPVDAELRGAKTEPVELQRTQG